MSFFTSIFTCCKSAKNIEHEKEHQELNLCVDFTGQVYEPSPTNSERSPNARDETYKNAKGGKSASHEFSNSVVQTEDSNGPNTKRLSDVEQGAEQSLGDCDRKGLTYLQADTEYNGSKSSSLLPSLSKFEPERKSRFALESDSLKKSKVQKQADELRAKSHASIGGIIVMNKIQLEKAEATSQSARIPERRK